VTIENENSLIKEEDITTEGTVTETDNGFRVEGKLLIETDSIGMVEFNEADLDLEFSADGSLKGISGTTEVPAPTNYFEFEEPIQADIGFFTGKYLNEHRDFEIQLEDERSYFVYNIGVTVELRIGANDDPGAHKPLSIKPPVGGHITFIADYTDPMYFFSVGHDLLGSNSIGASFGGHIPYIPTQPVDDIVSFGAKSVRGGKFSFFKVMEATGVYYENKGMSADINLEEPLESDFGIGYRAGINGSLALTIPVKSFISLDFPIGQGSAAVVAEASAQNGVTARAFVNGLVEPDVSWWPSFIPLQPNGSLNAYGYVAQSGKMDIGLSGTFGIEMPDKTRAVEGSLKVTEESFTMEGKVEIDGETWGAKGIFTTDETTYLASPPDNFANGISEIVTQQIDSAFAETERALEDLNNAAEDYEFELSLRGLRGVLPTVVDRAHQIINEAVAAGIKSGRDQANKILSDYGRVLCSDNIASVVNGTVKPYRDALNRLKNAVNTTNDTEQSRNEIEAALRQLAALDRINKTAKVSITHGNKAFIVPKCTQQSTVTRNISIKATVISSEQKSQLLNAADNVKYITETSNIKIEAERLVAELPSIEELERLRESISSCVKELTDNIGDAGITKNHKTEEYTYFVMINGERKEVSGFDVFDGEALIEVARPNTAGCDAEEAFKEFMLQYKK
ncbi:MAG TPA: hypothetical protein VKN36_17030, partial [Eudoraea sp.]|nr:hypothetical protein [Eudoraea sp.]